MSRQEKMYRRSAALTAAVLSAIVTMPVAAVITNQGTGNGGADPLADPRIYDVSTSGATALGALMRGANTNSNNFPTGEQNGLWRLGNEPLDIGRSTYNFNAGAAQFLGYRTQPGSGSILGADRLIYQYHETGSINGVLETLKSGGLYLPTGFGNELDAAVASQSAPLWRMGWSQINATTYIVDSSGNTSATAGGYLNAYAQPKIRIGFSDVRSFQAFAADDLSGTGSPDRLARDLTGTGDIENAQYGVGRKAYNPKTRDNGTNFQALANRSVIAGEGGTDASTSHLRNETLAIVPFAVVSNPGTGIAKLDEKEVRYLNGVGRLPNGANFNSTTREIGSGTRNQGNNNFEIDPSWGGGERDRRYVNSGTFSDVDANGNAVTVRSGDELNPNRDLFGVSSSDPSSQQAKEHRVGPQMRFSDKNSGGSGVRPTVINNRMAIGPNLSVGDVADRGLANLNGTIPSNAQTDPLRVVKIDFYEKNNGGAGEDVNGITDEGYVQPTAYNVTNGIYQQWSAAQAVTVIGIDDNADGIVDRRGTVAEDTNPNKLIWGDTDDQTQAPNGSTLGTPVGPAGEGIHRKFLNNIRQSVTAYPSNAITPADAVIDAGFVPEQVMKVSKEFDGGVQTYSNSPAGFNPSLYDLLVTNDPPGGAKNLKSRLNWIDPSTDPVNSGSMGFVGKIGSGGVTYKIFAEDIPTSGSGASTPTKAIEISFRTVLAGDMDGNGVRDLADVEELAQAFAASEAQGNIAGTAAVSNLALGLSSDELIVLTDFDGSGNISGTNASPIFRAVDTKDVVWFLKGATVDTVNANPDTGYAGSANIQTRREDGVRLGKLKKNGAIDTFNTTLQNMLGQPKPIGAGNWTQGALDAMKVQKSDVDGDGEITRYDARFVNNMVGVAPYSLSLAEIMVNFDVDPIYAELTDDNMISHIDPDGAGPLQSDFQIARAELGAYLLDGDADFDGEVTSMDFAAFIAGYGDSGRKWSEGDFSGFDGKVTTEDFNLLAGNFGLTAPVPGSLPASALGAAVPEPASLSVLALGAMGLLARRRR